MKTSTRLPMVALLGVAACAGLSGCGMPEYETQKFAAMQMDMDKRQTFFVLTKDLPPGHTIVPDDFELKETQQLLAPYNGIPINWDIKEKDKQTVVGRVTSRYLAQGTLLELSDVYAQGQTGPGKETAPAASTTTTTTTSKKH